MCKKIAILQSNYIPWKGYFDLINSVDEFVLYDDVQYTKNDWRNRNIIKSHTGLQWLTIPVKHQNSSQLIKDIMVSNKNWTEKHWKTLSQNYAKSKFFSEYKDIFEHLYLSNSEKYLSNINYNFITAINDILNIKTTIRRSSEFSLPQGRCEKLIEICKSCGASEYLSGPVAQKYLEIEKFTKEKITVNWMDYSDYPEYSQIYGHFVGNVSVLDLLFNAGGDSIKFMKSFSYD